MRVAVIAIARLEGRYLQEWVDHYKSLGFANAIICDNDHDEDDEDIKEIDSLATQSRHKRNWIG